MSLLNRIRLKPQRLHHQVVLLASSVLLVVLVLLGAYTAREQTAIAQAAVAQQAQVLARHVSNASANLILTHSLDELEALVRRSADFDAVRSIQVLTPDGRSLSRVERVAGQEPRPVYGLASDRFTVPQVAQAELSYDRAAQRMVAWHEVRADQRVAWVRVEFDTRSLSELRYRIWRNAAIAALLAVLSCSVLLAWSLRAPMRALERAKRFAFQMVADHGAQLAKEPGPLEVEELTDALNEASMLLRQHLLLLEHNLSARQAGAQALAKKNAELSAVFALSPDGLVTFDDHGRVQFANEAFFSLTGLSSAQLLGSSEAELDAALRALSSDASAFKGIAAAFLAPTMDDRVPSTITLQGVAPTVLMFFGQCSDAESVSRVLYVRDVTQQYALDQLKSEFQTMAAHELRTPLTSIVGFTELMLRREMPADKRRELLECIHRQSHTMMAIINELRDLADIESRRGQAFAMEAQDLVALVRSQTSAFVPPEGRSPPGLIEAPGVALAWVEPQRFIQALRNVVSNAYQYSPGGEPVDIRVEHGVNDAGEPCVGIAVQDHGMGISPENLARVGERFFRADKSGNVPGTGLGMSIVKELMQLMGGRLTITSAVQQGTCVTLWLRSAEVVNPALSMTNESEALA